MGCANKKETKNMQATENIQIEAIPIAKQFTYAVSVSAFTSYELYINDIAAEKDYDPGSQAAIEMNPYLLGNGKHTIKLRLLPTQGRNLIDPDGYELSHFELVKVIKNPNGRGLKYDEEIMKLPLPPMPTPLPVIELEWEVEINDLPYELEGWKNSKVFKKEDSIAVKKQVVAYYEELRTILNEGNSDEWKKQNLKKRKEFWTCVYEKNSNIKENWKAILNEVREERKGNMLPLEDYKLHFYANGRVLSLERNKTEEFEGYDANIKGWGVLINKNKDGGVYHIGVMLHMPKGSDTFEIIR